MSQSELEHLKRIRFQGDEGWPDWAGRPGDPISYRMVRLIGEDEWLALIPLILGERVAVCTPGGVGEFWDYEIEHLGDLTIAEIAFQQFPDMHHSRRTSGTAGLTRTGLCTGRPQSRR